MPLDWPAVTLPPINLWNAPRQRAPKRVSAPMDQYQNLAMQVMRHGQDAPNRTGIDARSIFGTRMRFNLEDGFPLVTLKKTFWRGAFVEMLWMLRGGDSVHWLHEHGVHIWDDWRGNDGHLGPIYGAQWRSWGEDYPGASCIDQLEDLLHGLKTRPYSRRHIVESWNVVDLPDETLSPAENVARGRMALAPCHKTVQFHVDRDNRLSAQVYQRSADVFIGVPFNISGYALLVHLVAHHLGFRVGELVWVGGDTHIYGNHFDQTLEMVRRKPRGLSKLHLLHHPDTPLWEIEPEHLQISDYHPHPPITGAVAV